MEKKQILARYFSNVFLIALSNEIKIFNRSEGNEISQRDFSIFVHEYWHYLMNISTTVRIRDFTTFYQLFPIFSKTLIEDGNGNCDASLLSDDDHYLINEICELYLAYNDGGIVDEEYELSDFKIISEVIAEEIDLTLHKKQIPFKKAKVQIEFESETGKIVKDLYITSNFIDESIANSIEKIIYNDNSNVSEIPYLTLSKLSEYFNDGTPLSNYELANIGTLSLLTTNPALSLNSLFKDYIFLRKTNSIQDSIDLLAKEIKPKFEEISSIILHDLKSILSVYKGREPSYQAIEQVYYAMEKCIYFRNNNLLFELAPFKNNVVDRELLNNLIFKLIKPCDILQECEGDENLINRDCLQTFQVEEITIGTQSLTLSTLNQVINCQLDYFKAHWALFNFMSSKNADSKCPYYTTCALPERINNPIKCSKKPWETFVRDGENCMYGHAVRNLIGISGLK